MLPGMILGKKYPYKRQKGREKKGQHIFYTVHPKAFAASCKQAKQPKRYPHSRQIKSPIIVNAQILLKNGQES